MSDLANLARSLHRRGLTPTQIRNRTGFLDSNDEPHIPIATIQQWLTETDAVDTTPRPLSTSASNTAQRPVAPPPAAEPQREFQRDEDHRALHEKMAVVHRAHPRLFPRTGFAGLAPVPRSRLRGTTSRRW